jgi:hypothetical protein
MARQGYDLVDPVRRKGLARDALHDGDGTLTYEHDRDRRERTPWRATQRAAWAALRRVND